MRVTATVELLLLKKILLFDKKTNITEKDLN